MKYLKNTLLILFFLSLTPINSHAITKYYFYVQFSDKNNTTYSLSNPSAFLSARAIARRASFNIAIDSTDLPVNTAYMTPIANFGISIHCVSKWMNGVTVLLADSSLMQQVRLMPFVKKVTYTGLANGVQASPKRVKSEPSTFAYGNAATQINQLNGNYLHNAGYTGSSMQIAVLDAGFLNVNTNVGFDSLRLQNRLLGVKNIAVPNSDVYTLDYHGANVLSILTGNLPNQYMGAAPHASYWLIRTEYSPTEYEVETDFWVAGIEFADSVGVDAVNSSLGYTTFDDASMNYTYSNMNGSFSRASSAATLAANKGILVCNSAGNEGNSAWHYIGVPADAPGIVAVGAATSTGEASTFTSYGPSADNRVKPEIAGMGTSTALINSSGSISVGNGTSYASPLVCGLMTCFLQYAKTNYSNVSIANVIDIAERSANLYATPSNRLGYGLPNFQTACAYLTTKLPHIDTDKSWITYYDRNSKQLIISRLGIKNTTINLYNSAGLLVYSIHSNGNQTQTIPTENFQLGLYILKISSTNYCKTKKTILN